MTSRARIDLGDTITHGVSGYIDQRCGCAVCREAHTRSRRELKWAKRRKMEEEGWLKTGKDGRRYNSHPDCPHGKSSGFNYWWCQCRKCTDYITESVRRSKKGGSRKS